MACSEHSDIDIAVKGTDAATYFALWRDLEQLCPDWLIDLRDINQPSHFANRICQYGELIHVGSNLESMN
jgi:predicted nucleotidyltransferase